MKAERIQIPEEVINSVGERLDGAVEVPTADIREEPLSEVQGEISQRLDMGVPHDKGLVVPDKGVRQGVRVNKKAGGDQHRNNQVVTFFKHKRRPMAQVFRRKTVFFLRE